MPATMNGKHPIGPPPTRDKIKTQIHREAGASKTAGARRRCPEHLRPDVNCCSMLLP